KVAVAAVAVGFVFRVCWPPLLLSPGIYSRLVRINGTTIWTEIPAKTSRLACFIHQIKNYSAVSLFGFLFQLTTKSMVTSAHSRTQMFYPQGSIFKLFIL
uniref:Uncharacterized protein n=1 Tax=Castor canadensis TaxID=51338 RepID=A0A8C0WHQ1_CASCN